MSGSGCRQIIKIENLNKVYKSKTAEVHALDDISLAVGEEEFISIVGQSGCGKSTLANIVTGLVSKSSGRVLVNGKEVTGPSQNIGIVFQKPVLMPWRNTIENILLPIEVLELDRNVYMKKADSLIELLGLKGFEHHHVNELSGGMQQRVSICRALIYDPPILIMDEPFGALDAFTREEMNTELLRIWQEKKKTILFITHSITEAIYLSDRVVIMKPRPGKIIDVVNIELERPRKIEMRSDPIFIKYEMDIKEKIFKRE